MLGRLSYKDILEVVKFGVESLVFEHDVLKVALTHLFLVANLVVLLTEPRNLVLVLKHHLPASLCIEHIHRPKWCTLRCMCWTAHSSMRWTSQLLVLLF